MDRIRVIEGITGGWKSDPILAPGGLTFWSFLFKVLGFIITAFAISLGAPFWFDLLKKLVELRKVVSGKQDVADDKKAMPRPATVGELGTTLTAISTGQPLAGLLLPPESISQLSVLASCAQQCYAAPLEFERLAKEKLGEDTKVVCISKRALIPFDDPTEDNPNDTDLIPVDTQVFVIRTAAQVLVACRGTEPKVLHDIATDARFKPAKVKWSSKPTEILAHRGFVAALDVVWEDLKTKIDEASGDAKLPVYFAGHSLGGAVAVLAATRFLAENGNDNRFGGLHTFGQPRVGNSAFADWATTLFQGRYTRAINHRDIVPQLPPPKVGEWEFKHFGIAHVFDAAGRLAINPSWFFRLADYALPDDELKAMFKQPVQNHDSYRYASLYAELGNSKAATA